MLRYLIERENEEMFRTTTRDIQFPDGETRRIETYRLIWIWYDRAIAYTYGPAETQILNLTLKCAAEENSHLSEALGRVLNYILKTGETQGLDYTDDKLNIIIGKSRAAISH